jgi:LL-diaminopimelate aminotransferase
MIATTYDVSSGFKVVERRTRLNSKIGVNEMKFSRRLEQLAPYPFVEISRILAEKRAAGEDVVTFGIGDPDIPTPDHIIEQLVQSAYSPPNHRYPETDGLPQLRRAISHWYEGRLA